MKVSILIPTKDRPERVAQAVACALNQTYDNIEVVVQDGGTEAPTLPNDPRLVYHRGKDSSITNAVNQAAERSSGDVLHMACDDDEMRPDTVANVVDVMRLHQQWTYGVIEIVRRTAVIEAYVLPTPRIDQNPYIVASNGESAISSGYVLEEVNGGWTWEAARLLRENYIPQPATFFTRSAFFDVGGFDESFHLCADYEMWGRLGARWAPAVRQHVDATYVRWPGSTSVETPELMAVEAEAIRARWAEHGLGWRP